MADLLRPEIHRLRKMNALPYDGEINWDADVNFPGYPPLTSKSASMTQQEVTSGGDTGSSASISDVGDSADAVIAKFHARGSRSKSRPEVKGSKKVKENRLKRSDDNAASSGGSKANKVQGKPTPKSHRSAVDAPSTRPSHSKELSRNQKSSNRKGETTNSAKNENGFSSPLLSASCDKYVRQYANDRVSNMGAGDGDENVTTLEKCDLRGNRNVLYLTEISGSNLFHTIKVLPVESSHGGKNADLPIDAKFVRGKKGDEPTPILSLSVAIDIERALREDYLSDLHEDMSTDKLFASLGSPALLEQTIRTLIANFKHNNKDRRVDELTASGYLLVNTQRYNEAINLLDNILACLHVMDENNAFARGSESEPDHVTNVAPKYKNFLTASHNGKSRFNKKQANLLSTSTPQNPSLSSSSSTQSLWMINDDKDSAANVYLALATALAMVGRGADAIAAMSDLLHINPNNIEALARRGEIYASIGDTASALRDCEKVIELADDESLREHHIARGKVLFARRKFRLAYKDFKKALKRPSGGEQQQRADAMLWHYIGKCEKEFGDSAQALKSLHRSVKFEETKEAIVDIAATLMEASRWEESLSYLEKAIAIDPKFRNIYGYRGMLYQNLGRHEDGIKDFNTCLSIDATASQCLTLTSSCHQALGNFSGAAQYFDRLMEVEPSSFAWFKKEAMKFFEAHADVPLSDYYPDKDIDAEIREGISKQATPTKKNKQRAKIAAQNRYGAINFVTVNSSAASRADDDEFWKRAFALYDATRPFRSWIQLDSPGFLPNHRHHASFGMMVLQMAQSMSAHVDSLKRGDGGLLIRNSAASKPTCPSSNNGDENSNGSCVQGYHVFGWRNLLDIAVRWRQVRMTPSCIRCVWTRSLKRRFWLSPDELCFASILFFGDFPLS